jgi:hypothetical protein
VTESPDDQTARVASNHMGVVAYKRTTSIVTQKQQQRIKSSLKPNTLKQPQEQQIDQCFVLRSITRIGSTHGHILHSAMTTTTTASHSNHGNRGKGWVSCRAWCALHKRRVVPWTVPQPFHCTPFPNNTIVEYIRVHSEPRAGKGISPLPESPNGCCGGMTPPESRILANTTSLIKSKET